jgi:hypothetical protein
MMVVNIGQQKTDGKCVMFLAENLNKGMGIARCICLTNAKLAIKTEERANRFIAEMLSLFLLFS